MTTKATSYIEKRSTNPLKAAERQAKKWRCGYDIREYKDGSVGLYTNNFKPHLYVPIKGGKHKKS